MEGTDNTGGGKFSLLFQDLALHLGWKPRLKVET